MYMTILNPPISFKGRKVPWVVVVVWVVVGSSILYSGKNIRIYYTYYIIIQSIIVNH